MSNDGPILHHVERYYASSPGKPTQDLFQVLSHDERIIVASDEGEGLIYTWNQSLTFMCWRRIQRMGSTDKWEDVEINVTMTTPDNFEDARKIALGFMRGEYDQSQGTSRRE